MAGVGATLFGLAALFLVGQALSTLALGRNAGAGQWLSPAVVSLVVALAYGRSLVRTRAGRTGVGPAPAAS